jgi:hypothetical protein
MAMLALINGTRVLRKRVVNGEMRRGGFILVLILVHEEGQGRILQQPPPQTRVTNFAR